MKRFIILPLFIIMSFGQNNATAIRDYYHYSLHDIEILESTITFGLGELALSANDKPNQIDGSIYYSLKLGKPNVSLERSEDKGVFDFEFDFKHDDVDVGFSLSKWDFDFDDIHNEMEFQLPPNLPTNLKLEFGLGEAEIDLTHLSLSDFDLECGMSEVDVFISKPNNQLCDKVSIEIGMADFNGHGLGNLNSNGYSIDVGLGDADIDLTGSFSQDADLDINVGLGSMNLVLPKNANIKLRADHSFLASVDVRDLLKKSENTFESVHWDYSLPTIDINISVGLGDIDVRVEQ